MKKIMMIGLSAAILILSACGKSGGGSSNNDPQTYYGNGTIPNYSNGDPRLYNSYFNQNGNGYQGYSSCNCGGTTCNRFQFQCNGGCGGQQYAYYYVPTGGNSAFSPYWYGGNTSSFSASLSLGW